MWLIVSWLVTLLVPLALIGLGLRVLFWHNLRNAISSQRFNIKVVTSGSGKSQRLQSLELLSDRKTRTRRVRLRVLCRAGVAEHLECRLRDSPSGPRTMQQQNRSDLPGSAQLLTQTVIFISNPKNVSPYFDLKTLELLDDS